MMRFIAYSLIVSMGMSACAKRPYALSERSYRKQTKTFSKTIREQNLPSLLDSSGQLIPADWVSTVNFNLRKPNYVIIHHTAQNSVEQTLKTFTLNKSQVSAHYLIGNDGKVYQLLNDYLRAWHGGVAKWGGTSDINSNSIGIELDNNGLDAFSDKQLESLIVLLQQLKKKYNIPTANFIGHSDIAPSRKVDPNVTFPWRKLADRGFGLMPDTLVTETAPANFDPVNALRIIGYDTTDLVGAIRAFKRHFLGKEGDADFSAAELDALYNLYCKY